MKPDSKTNPGDVIRSGANPSTCWVPEIVPTVSLSGCIWQRFAAVRLDARSDQKDFSGQILMGGHHISSLLKICNPKQKTPPASASQHTELRLGHSEPCTQSSTFRREHFCQGCTVYIRDRHWEAVMLLPTLTMATRIIRWPMMYDNLNPWVARLVVDIYQCHELTVGN